MHSITSSVAGLVVAGALLAGTASAQSGYDSPTPGGGGGYGPPTPGNGTPTLTIKVRKTNSKKALRSGIKVRFTSNVAVEATGRAYKGAKTYGTKTKTLPTGSGTLTLKLNRTAKKKIKKLKRGKTLRFSVAGRVRDVSGTESAIVTKTVKVKKKR